jgi:hypothetical protein
MPKASGKKKSTKTSSTKRAVSYKDLQIAYLSNGVSAIQQLLAEGSTTKSSVRRALQAFTDAGAAAATLDDFVKTHIGQGRRGRAAPLVGAERSYRAQKLNSGSTFLRLPLEALGVQKGGLVTVRFERDRILVTRG